MAANNSVNFIAAILLEEEQDDELTIFKAFIELLTIIVNVSK